MRVTLWNLRLEKYKYGYARALTIQTYVLPQSRSYMHQAFQRL